MKPKIFISQPMRGLSDEEVIVKRACVRVHLEALGYEIVNNLTFNNETFSDEELLKEHKHPQLCRIGYDLIEVSKCDALYCVSGWEKKRGCQIEEFSARVYGLDIIYE